MDASEMPEREASEKGDGDDAPGGGVGGVARPRCPQAVARRRRPGRSARAGGRASRTRGLRLMRVTGRLSLHRARPWPDAAHDRRTVTDAPNVMWASDGAQITIVQDGKVWRFGVAERWAAALVGWHVIKRGTRREALQAIGIASLS